MGWVCYKVREPGRIVFLKLPVDSLFFFFLLLCAAAKSPSISRKIWVHYIPPLAHHYYLYVRIDKTLQKTSNQITLDIM